MKSILIIFLTSLLYCPLYNPFANENSMNKGQVNDAFVLITDGPKVYEPGGAVNICVTVNDITLDGGLSYVSFRLYYDNKKVTPMVKNGFTEVSENRHTFIEKCPSFNSWEVIGILDENECFYELTFGTDKVSGERAAVNDGDLAFVIPFKVLITADDDIPFLIPDEHVEGGNADFSQIEMPGRAEDFTISGKTVDIPPGGDDITDPIKVETIGNKSVLFDGDKALDVKSAQDPRVFLYRNKSFDNPTVELVISKDSVRTVNKVDICFYCDYNNEEIILPKDNRITVSYSDSSGDFILLGSFVIENNLQTERGIIEADIDFGIDVQARYIKIAFVFGESEFLALTEVNAYYRTSEENKLELVDDSVLYIENGFLYGLEEKKTLSYIRNQFKGEVTVSGCGTGDTVSADESKVYIIIFGEINGDAKIDAKDYLLVKRAIMDTYELSEIQLKAACISGKAFPSVSDCIIIKRHSLGLCKIEKSRKK